MKDNFDLQSLLETHDNPFKVIDTDLRIVAVNRAWETHFGTDREEIIGQHCCLESDHCRHQKLFQSLEPYAGLYPHTSGKDEPSIFRVRGYPLLDSKGQIFIGEVIFPEQNRSPDGPSNEMTGRSPHFTELQASLTKAAKSDVPVMLIGETGTGKEVAAHFLHQHSQRADGKLIVVDCTSLGEELIESELYGHEKGAFTGASGTKKGLFQLADKGTLFLDEIGELPLSQQPKLLRALETGQFRRVGGTSNLKADVRVICATHQNLPQMVADGLFREDLYYRLSVFPITAPPLRERREDIPLICDKFLQQTKQPDESPYQLSKEALKRLLQHHWPGNIRELRNVLQLAMAICDGNTIQERDIRIQPPIGTTKALALETQQNFSDQLEETESTLNPIEQMEAEFILELLNRHGGNRQSVAEEMNISERTLYRKLKRYNLNRLPH